MSDSPLRDAHASAEPTPALRERVVSTLRQQGHLVGRRSSSVAARLPWIGALAAALLLGFLAGRARIGGEAPGNRYLMLLYEDAGYRDDRPVQDIVSEYARWADSLDRAGALVAGEKLADPVYEVVSGGGVAESSGAAPTGLFIVRAGSAEAATAIARGSPHIKYGGRIVVRGIERTP